MPLSKYLIGLVEVALENVAENVEAGMIEIPNVSNVFALKANETYDLDKYELVGGVQHQGLEYLVIKTR